MRIKLARSILSIQGESGVDPEMNIIMIVKLAKLKLKLKIKNTKSKNYS